MRPAEQRKLLKAALKQVRQIEGRGHLDEAQALVQSKSGDWYNFAFIKDHGWKLIDMEPVTETKQKRTRIKQHA